MVLKRLQRAAHGNQADRARDHLANERTYLAWLRTSVNVMVLGLVIAKFLEEEGTRAEVAGLIMVAVGFLLLVYGTDRTRRLTTELETGKFSTDYRGPVIMAGIVMLALLAAIVLVAI